MYVKSELYKVMKSKKCMFFMALMILIPFVDLISNMLHVFLDYWLYSEAYVGGMKSGMILHPAMASFLAGSGDSHLGQMLLIWVLPIYLMLIYSDSYIREVSYGYNNIIFTKGKKKKIIKDRFMVSFLIPFTVCFCSLLLNFLLAQIIFFGGKDFLGMRVDESFMGLCMSYPNISYIIYMMVFCFLSGGCGVLCTGISYLIPNNKIAYPLVFVMWFVQIISPYSITYAMQPFIEYGPNYFVPALIINCILVVGVYVVSFVYMEKKDEI